MAAQVNAVRKKYEQLKLSELTHSHINVIRDEIKRLFADTHSHINSM